MTTPEPSRRLLIVDDDDIDRRHYARLLAHQPLFVCDIVQARNGASGLAMLRAQAPDCLLLDYSLPDMTGLEFLADAAGDGELPCAVVLITGHGNEAIAVAAMKRGVRDYLVKEQVTGSTLWHAIAGAVAQRELHQRLAASEKELRTSHAALQQEVATRRAAEIELRAAKDAAEHASQAKSRFVAMVTHELRTPLQGILGYAELLRLQGKLTVQQDRHVDAMMRAGRHLLDMIERVLDFARIESGKLDLQASLVAVRDLVEECMVAVGLIAAKRGLDLRLVRGLDAPACIVADSGRLHQVLMNLLGNALKYTQSGSVELRALAGATQGGLRIEVADTGPGIDPAVRDRLFKNFERLGVVSAEGAGLGLAIATRLATAMKGSIGYEPNPGGGSVFWLDLPPGDARAGAAEAAADGARPAMRAVGKSLLLVDDMEMNRDVIGAFLRAAGHVVTLAESGAEAVQLAREQTFDLILMDVRMPEMDGLEATRRIRALPGARGKVPILGVTAYAFLDQVAECRAAGMDGHVAKPVSYVALVEAVDSAIANVPAKWSGMSPAPAKAAAAEKSPAAALRFDRDMLEETLAFLSREDAATHLKALRARKEEMVRLLGLPTDPGLLADTAHALASTAGRFGFAGLSELTRHFEFAMSKDAPEAAELGQALRAEIQAAIVTLDELGHESRLQVA
jgi:signal transduction histidine kinase